MRRTIPIPGAILDGAPELLVGDHRPDTYALRKTPERHGWVWLRRRL